MTKKTKFKSINSRLLVAHNYNLSPEFWLNHEIDKCKECQNLLASEGKND